MEDGEVLLQFANMTTIPDVAPLCQGGEKGDRFDIVRPVGCDRF